MAKKRKPITIYSVLALLALVLGGAATVVFGFVHIDNWIKNSGERFDVGITQTVQLQQGELVVFYESPVYLPAIHNQIHLALRDEQGNRIAEENIAIDPEEDYAPRTFLPMHQISGRPMWRVQIPADGIYTIRVQNDHEDQDPVNDKVVIGKNPQSFRTLKSQNMMFKVIGLIVTGALFIGLYIVHGVTLSRRAAADRAAEELDSAGMPLDGSAL